MKRYKFIGDPLEYSQPDYNFKLVKGHIFNENYSPGKWDVSLKSLIEDYPEDWEEVTDEIEESTADFEYKVTTVLDNLKDLLISKNKKYGDSAINPIRIFSKSSNIEQIKVRLDDKLSRLKTQHIEEDEDVLNDLIGYLILLKIANNE